MEFLGGFCGEFLFIQKSLFSYVRSCLARICHRLGLHIFTTLCLEEDFREDKEGCDKEDESEEEYEDESEEESEEDESEEDESDDDESDEELE